jgi:hypothetical protein
MSAVASQPLREVTLLCTLHLGMRATISVG